MDKAARYAVENKTLFYRSRFTISPENKEVGEIWPRIVTAVQGWLEEKEESVESKGFDSFLGNLTDDVVNLSKSVKGAKGSSYVSSRMASGSLECQATKTSLKTKALFDEGKGTPSYWAMEYVEQSTDDWYRKWYTDVGITAAGDGSYVVNTRVAIADDPAFICDRPFIPPRNTPRFVAKMLDIQGCVASSNGISLANDPQPLTKYNMSDFGDALESDERTIPFVVVSALRDQPGKYAVDPDRLAKKLRGSAVVYALDCSDYGTWLCYQDVFFRSEASIRYRVNPGFMRVFFPGVNLDDPDGSKRHHYYTQEALLDSDEGKICNDVCGAFTRLYRRVQGEALDPASIALIESQQRRKRLESKVRELRAARNMLEHAAPSYESLHTEQELKSEIERVRAEGDATLKETTEFYESLIEEYKAEASRQEQGDDILELQIQLEDLGEENRKLQSSANAKDYQIQELSKNNSQLERRASEAKTQADLVCAMREFPKTCADALTLAERAFSTRLAVTQEAKEAASDANRNIDSGETFDILRCLAVNLWPKYFEKEESDGDAGIEFRNETGYEIAFYESTMTKKDSKLQRLRQISYDGRTIDISSHVKGKSGNRDELLRVHFYVDRKTGKIVVGHCGNHLKTAGTRKAAK